MKDKETLKPGRAMGIYHSGRSKREQKKIKWAIIRHQHFTEEVQ